jgi:radical SAM superfamily enzyme YgiQ (UPF0313 family)
MIRKVILFGDMRLGTKSIPFKSSSISRLAYALRKKGYLVKQVHHCVGFTYDEIKSVITNFSEGEKVCVGVSTSFLADDNSKDRYFWGYNTYVFLLNVGRVCKQFNFPYLLGGWEITETALEDKFDGWGFSNLSKVVTYFIEGKDTQAIEDVCNDKHIVYKLITDDRKLVLTKENEDFSDCASTLLPEDFLMQGESVCTEVAAGCIFSCSFCNYAALGKKKNQYTRTYDSFEEEIKENYKNFKISLYNLTDNIVNDTPEKIRYLIDVREKTGIDFKWSGYVRLDTIRTKEQAILLKESGMIGASFGIESFYKASGPYIGKVTDKERLMKSLETMRNVFNDDAILTGLFIAGLPEEPIDHIIKTHEWLDSIEGRYYLDQHRYSSFRLFDYNADKNDINKSRNNPFRDYTIIDRSTNIKGKSKSRNVFNTWVSPWTSYEEVDEICKQIEREQKNRLGGAFFLAFLVNSGYDLNTLIRDIRDSGKQGIAFNPPYEEEGKKFIRNYIDKVLSHKSG